MGCDAYVRSLDCGDGVIGIYICPNFDVKYLHFIVGQLFYKKAVKRNEAWDHKSNQFMAIRSFVQSPKRKMQCPVELPRRTEGRWAA